MAAQPNDELPIACTLSAGDYKTRLAWIADLNAAALLAHQRDGLRLELTYAGKARNCVREMVRREQACCAFLDFEIHEAWGGIRLTITAPERARGAADGLFAPFFSKTLKPAGCACCGVAS